MDFPARDHVLVEQLRNKGAIIFAKAVNTEYNGRAGDPGGRNRPDSLHPRTPTPGAVLHEAHGTGPSVLVPSADRFQQRDEPDPCDH